MKGKVTVKAQYFLYESRADIIKEWKYNLSKRELSIGRIIRSPVESKLCYGYMKNNKGNILINEFEADVVCDIYEMHLYGRSLNGMCESLKFYKSFEFDMPDKEMRKMVKKILRSEEYAGYKFAKQGDKIIKAITHPGIIDKKCFAVAQELKIQNVEKSVTERMDRLEKAYNG